MMQTTKRVKGDIDIKKFDINQHTQYRYHLNKIYDNISSYFRCAERKTGCRGIARATIISIDEIELQEIGLHNHTAPYHSRPTSAIRAEVKAFVGRKGGTASQIRNEFISQKGAELNSEILPPTLSMFQNYVKQKNQKKDITLDLIRKHGSKGIGSTKFIRHFSLDPFIIILSVNEVVFEFKEKKKILFVDDTYSMSTPSTYLMCILTIIEGKGLQLLYFILYYNKRKL